MTGRGVLIRVQVGSHPPLEQLATALPDLRIRLASSIPKGGELLIQADSQTSGALNARVLPVLLEAGGHLEVHQGNSLEATSPGCGNRRRPLRPITRHPHPHSHQVPRRVLCQETQAEVLGGHIQAHQHHAGQQQTLPAMPSPAGPREHGGPTRAVGRGAGRSEVDHAPIRAVVARGATAGTVVDGVEDLPIVR